MSVNSIKSTSNLFGHTSNVWMGKAKRKKKKPRKTAATTSTDEAASTDHATVIRVPEDYRTLNEAMERVEADPNILTISVGKGKHRVEKDEEGFNYLPIHSPITVLGRGDKNEVVVMGGFEIEKGSQDKVHLQNMTIRHLKGNGVSGGSSYAPVLCHGKCRC